MVSKSRIMGWHTHKQVIVSLWYHHPFSVSSVELPQRVCLLCVLLSASLRGLCRLLNKSQTVSSVRTVAMQNHWHMLHPKRTWVCWCVGHCMHACVFAWMSSGWFHFLLLFFSRTGPLAFQSTRLVSYERSPYLKMIHPLKLLWVSERGGVGGLC